MIGWYLLAAYLGFGLLSAALVLYTYWRSEGDLDEVDAVAAFFYGPLFWAVIAVKSLKDRIRRLEGRE